MADPSRIASSSIESLYASLGESNARWRKQLGRPLTLAEKVLLAPLVEHAGAAPERRRTHADLSPDRVAMQDATAQMAILQFALAGRDQAAVPTTVHCDHLIRARSG